MTTQISTPQPCFYITWTPRPDLWHCTAPVKQFDDTFDYFKLAITCWSDWALCPEPNSNGNIHYHGWFQLKNRASILTRWYSKALPKLKYNGLVRINKVRHKLDTSYMNKNTLWTAPMYGVKLPIMAYPPSRVSTPSQLSPTTEDAANSCVPFWDVEEGVWRLDLETADHQ